MKKFNYKLEIEIFRNSTQNNLGVLRCSFSGFGCPKRHPDALLAKTMLDRYFRGFLKDCDQSIWSLTMTALLDSADMIACHKA